MGDAFSFRGPSKEEVEKENTRVRKAKGILTEEEKLELKEKRRKENERREKAKAALIQTRILQASNRVQVPGFDRGSRKKSLLGAPLDVVGAHNIANKTLLGL